MSKRLDKRRAIADERRAPFFWITPDAMRRIRAEYPWRDDGKGKRTQGKTVDTDPTLPVTIAIYTALVELANEARTREAIGETSCGFAAERADIAVHSGASVKSVDRATALLERIELVEVERRRVKEDRNLPNRYVLIEGGRQPDALARQGDAQGGRQADAEQPQEEGLGQEEPPTPSGSEEFEEVFSHWISVMGKEKHPPKKSDRRRSRVKARLAEGFTVDDLKAAVTGCSLSPHHMGQNDRGPKGEGKPFNDLELICRDAEHVEDFRDLAGAQASKEAVVSASPYEQGTVVVEV